MKMNGGVGLHAFNKTNICTKYVKLSNIKKILSVANVKHLSISNIQTPVTVKISNSCHHIISHSCHYQISCRIVMLPLVVGTCQVITFHFSVFLNLCVVLTRQVQRRRLHWKPPSTILVSIASTKFQRWMQFCFPVQRNRVLKSTAVPSIFKRIDDVPEKNPRKLEAAEKLASKRVNSLVRRVSQWHCSRNSQCIATGWVIAVIPWRWQQQYIIWIWAS